ncbi:hydrogenase nickel incorporation protein HypA [bacterium BMS3Abin02]|nr:hydrogenase nickel incorporation protein HypA [bacterium BMS3Abin02]GBE22256.1 hydrogenase nickel incorporation protein HypA [bacterium BMS3Bbin01]HDH26390.1 hydrogenase maturation nickel metallochaperone HypA [Actinomycetota bacterium]HDK46097.1 hydrogenase maturation nickel metallochaperone HypA [Actinomycetota bacterium]HDL49592.1 hydrogenase maturation nickel metallochaperone HypA [Actinomycetota bacterium]
MHERGLIAGVIAEVVERAGGGRVGRVVVTVGPEVDPLVVKTAWLSEVTGTTAETAELVVQETLDTMRCFTCGIEYEGGKLDPCPDCGRDGLVIRAAPEVALKSWDPA